MFYYFGWVFFFVIKCWLVWVCWGIFARAGMSLIKRKLIRNKNIKTIETGNTDWIKFSGFETISLGKRKIIYKTPMVPIIGKRKFSPIKQEMKVVPVIGKMQFIPTKQEMKMGEVYYFELTIHKLSPDITSSISFGLAPIDYDPHNSIGGNFIRWHSDYGITNFGISKYHIINMMLKFGAGDVVGFGFYPTTGKYFFTKNDLDFKRYWMTSSMFEELKLVPTVIVHNSNNSSEILFSINRNCWKSRERFKYHVMNTQSFLEFQNSKSLFDCVIQCST